MLVDIVNGKPEGYLTLSEAAKKFGVSKQTVRNWCKRGEFDVSEMFFIRNTDQIEAYYISEKAPRPTFIWDRREKFKKRPSPYDYYTNVKNDLLKHYPTLDFHDLSDMDLHMILDDTLTARETSIFGLYYDQSQTLETIAHECGVTKERIRQIKNAALRRVQKQVRHLQRSREIEAFNNLSPAEKPIDVLDLSVRAWNCLYRSNIDTVSELLKQSPEQLIKIRSLGWKTYQEILNKAHAHGYLFVWEEHK